jgi:hypothetical protein
LNDLEGIDRFVEQVAAFVSQPTEPQRMCVGGRFGEMG